MLQFGSRPPAGASILAQAGHTVQGVSAPPQSARARTPGSWQPLDAADQGQHWSRKDTGSGLGRIWVLLALTSMCDLSQVL